MNSLCVPVLPGVPIFYIELLVGFKVLQTLSGASVPLGYYVLLVLASDESDTALYQTDHFIPLSILGFQGLLIPGKTSICNFPQGAVLPHTYLTVYRFALITLIVILVFDNSFML